MHRLQGLWMGTPGTVPSEAPQFAQSLREGVAPPPFFFVVDDSSSLEAIASKSCESCVSCCRRSSVHPRYRGASSDDGAAKLYAAWDLRRTSVR